MKRGSIGEVADVDLGMGGLSGLKDKDDVCGSDGTGIPA